MSNFRNTTDILDGVLRRCGEITSDVGVSPRTSAALLYLNQIHYNLIAGGCELNIDVDEPWVWARARRPTVIQLNTAITTGTVAVTHGSQSGTFSTAPQLNGSNVSVQGWHIQLQGCPEVYKIVSHVSGATAFVLDSLFPQGTNASQQFRLFQIDYDVVTSVLNIDSENNIIDFIESGTTVLTATIPAGGYTPAALATAVAAALNAAGTHGNTYSCSYDTNLRLFTLTSNLGGSGSPLFTLKTTSANYYRSAVAKELGFDYLDQTGAGTYTGNYPLSSMVKFTNPARIFFGSAFGFGLGTGTVGMVDSVAFDRDYPMVDIHAGVPTSFCVIREKQDGTITIRFNRYPMSTTAVQGMRVELEHIPIPRDLQNNTASIPLIPRKFIRILEYGAAAYLLKDKSDAKSGDYMSIAQAALNGMMKQNRKELEKVGVNFGNVIARADLMPDKRHHRANSYGYDSEGTA